MFTRRDCFVAVAATAFTAGAFALAQQAAPVTKSWAIDWNSVPAKTNSTDTVRTFFKGPTATLNDLDVHVTTLNPGQAPHQPHKHPNEEMLIVKEGQLTVLINGEWKTVGPGSVVYLASNVMHGARNDGTVPVTYHVVGFRTEKTPAQ
jgi:quercetin dioxygenase-like cupin family protein